MTLSSYLFWRERTNVINQMPTLIVAQTLTEGGHRRSSKTVGDPIIEAAHRDAHPAQREAKDPPDVD